MKIQKLLIATVAGTVFLFLIDWVWYGMLMKDSMVMPNARVDANGQHMPDFMWLVISYLVFSLAFVSIYGKLSGGSSKVNSGLNYGIWVGVMVGLAMNLMWYSLTTMMTMNQVLMDGAYSIVKYIILGIIVAYLSAEAAGDRGGGGKTPG